MRPTWMSTTLVAELRSLVRCSMRCHRIGSLTTRVRFLGQRIHIRPRDAEAMWKSVAPLPLLIRYFSWTASPLFVSTEPTLGHLLYAIYYMVAVLWILVP